MRLRWEEYTGFPRDSGRRRKRLYPVSCDSRNLSRPFQFERSGRTDTAYEGHQRNGRAGGHEHRADRIFGNQEKGFKGFIKSFAEPVPFIAPLNVLEVFIRPLSLCMRLFGNILGGFVIMELLKIVAPILVPIPFSFYFDVFDGLIQMYVFVFLTAIFMKELMD